MRWLTDRCGWSTSADQGDAVAAGDSAREQSRRLAEVASTLQRKAEWAAKRAESFEAGSQGELEVARALAPLTAEGWFLLHDRDLPAGGNVDHIAVGPPGVAVVDAKAWTYPVRVSGGRLYTGKFTRDSQLDKILEQRGHVEAALKVAHPLVPVRGCLSLTGEADRNREAVTVRDVEVVGVDTIAPHLLRAPAQLPPAEVEAVFRTLSAAFRPAGAPALEAYPAEPMKDPDEDALPATTERCRIYYLNEWRGHGQRRLYLKDCHGIQLGWKDAISEEVVLECAGDDRKLAGAVLAAATSTGVALAAQSLPRVPVPVLGRKLLGRFARVHVSVLVGQLWRKNNRLYGTLIDPHSSTFKLGYVDLATNDLRPSIQGPLSQDHQPAQYYLRLLRDRQPPAHER
jgi:hypothetical protein